MAKFQGFNFLNYLTIGFLGALHLLLFSWIFTAFDIPKYIVGNNWISFTGTLIDVNLRNQVQNAGFVSVIGDNFAKLLSFFNLNLMNIVSIIIGTIIILMLGRIAVGYFALKPKLRILSSFFLGGLIGGLIIALMLQVNPIGSILSMGLFFLLVGIALQLEVNAKSIKFLRE